MTQYQLARFLGFSLSNTELLLLIISTVSCTFFVRFAVLQSKRDPSSFISWLIAPVQLLSHYLLIRHIGWLLGIFLPILSAFLLPICISRRNMLYGWASLLFFPSIILILSSSYFLIQ